MRYKLPNKSRSLLDCYFEGVKHYLAHSKVVSQTPNLRTQRREIQSLRTNKDITTKGDTTIVMNTSHLI